MYASDPRDTRPPLLVPLLLLLLDRLRLRDAGIEATARAAAPSDKSANLPLLSAASTAALVADAGSTSGGGDSKSAAVAAAMSAVAAAEGVVGTVLLVDVVGGEGGDAGIVMYAGDGVVGDAKAEWYCWGQ
ncbi:hypothetical protein BC828DRAFT_393279 [Blastocladiella britannica]|nr:hypothetical protein BC828DRAFT_393279 [Blastocladiella britannica]